MGALAILKIQLRVAFTPPSNQEIDSSSKQK
jgi:hypothetical protein